MTAVTRREIERRFVAAVLKDDTGERLAQCQALPAEVFTDAGCARAWWALTHATSYQEGALHREVRPFFAHETTGMDYTVDRDHLHLAWLERLGLREIDRWLPHVPRDSAAAAAWRPVNAAELCTTPPATPTELVHGLLYRGGTMMLSGASKAHKTYTMLAAGIAIAGGHPWLGFATTATPVLYLNLELQDFAAGERVRTIAAAMGVPPPRTLHLYNLRGHLVTIGTFEARIREALDRTGAGLVIIDPHYKLASASGTEENSNDAQGALLYRIESAVCARGAGVMIAHHFAKGDASSKRSIDRAAGGGALARWPDVIMTLTEHTEPACVTAEFTLRNFAPVKPCVLRWDFPVWRRTDGLNPAHLKLPAHHNELHPAEELLAHLTDGMTNAEWREAAMWTDATFRRKRDKLIRLRHVRQTSTGRYYRVQHLHRSKPSLAA